MYIIRPLAFFPRDLKKLKKKYPQIKKDLEPLIEKLEQGIFEGDKLQGFIGDVYKVRVGSSDQKKLPQALDTNRLEGHPPHRMPFVHGAPHWQHGKKMQDSRIP